MKHTLDQSAILQGIVAEKDRIKGQRDELLKALKLARDELVDLNNGIGWRDGEWPQVTTANIAIANVELSL